jgi:hypothetical protein
VKLINRGYNWELIMYVETQLFHKYSEKGLIIKWTVPIEVELLVDIGSVMLSRSEGN